MQKSALLFILLLVQLAARGQVEDYVVTTKMDTIKGDIRILTYDIIDRVQIGTGKDKRVFTAVQLRSLSLKGKIYHPVRIEANIRMMQLITPGFLSLYGFRVGTQMTYDGRYLVKFGGRSIEVPNLIFKKTMGSFLSDCPAVAERVEKGNWGRSDLDSVILVYNQCMTGSISKPEVATTTEGDERIQIVSTLFEQVANSDLANKKDVLDLLQEIKQKLGRKEPVPNYLVEGLKSYLNDKPSFATNLEQAVQAIKN